MVYSSGAGNNRCTVGGRILGRCDRYDTGTYMSPTKHVIVLKCPNASKTGRQAYIYSHLLYADYYLYAEEYVMVLTSCDHPSEP